MVGLVLVSHSRKLALAATELVRQTVGSDVPIAGAGGVGEDHAELGTDAIDILEAINGVSSEQGVAVLMDMGSAVLSAQTALDFLDEDQRSNVRLCAAPLVEGAIAAAVQARLGSPLGQVIASAAAALVPKQEHLGDVEPPGTPLPAESQPVAEGIGQPVEIAIENPHGLHLRPAAVLLGALAGIDARVTVENLTKARGPVDATSLVEIARLQISKGDRARFHVAGPQADEAIERIRALAASRFGEAAAEQEEHLAPPDPHSEDGLFTTAPGIAIGRPFLVEAVVDLEQIGEDPIAEERIPVEIAKLNEGLDASIQALRQQRCTGDDNSFGAERRAMIEVQTLLLADPRLKRLAETRIREGHKSAARAWAEVMAEQAALQETAEDPYVRERAADFRELTRLLLSDLADFPAASPTPALPEDAFVLVCEELSPSLLDRVRSPHLQGIAQFAGGPTSHGSILARAAGIPCVGGARSLAEPIQRAQQVAFDAGAKQLWTDPDHATLAHLLARRAAMAEARAAYRAGSQGPAQTTEGVTVAVLANVSSLEDTLEALKEGAEGIGLLRVEIILQRFGTLPDDQAQLSALQEVLEPWGARPVVVRLADVGGDKPLPFLPVGAESNPFLGLRGIRLLQANPRFLRSHLCALLRLAATRELSVMVPMVADAPDLLRVRDALVEARDALEKRGAGYRWPPTVGAMIETPAAALSIPSLAPLAAFFSLGTNDLVQYLLCAERGHPGLAEFQDGLHRAVLKTLGMIVADAQGTTSRPVSICGELAADPEAIPILLGLGLRSLSVAPTLVARTKSVVRTLSVQKCQRAWQELASSDAVRGSSVRQWIRTKFPELAAFGA
ncbi:MAG: phosphoenolpyruvate--protein phosphotransferase [Verrucomicrobia bacterium]|nr:phosphoenolpyruvate--protein phosphotransferase [Verrucomicrobiota bacterium]